MIYCHEAVSMTIVLDKWLHLPRLAPHEMFKQKKKFIFCLLIKRFFIVYSRIVCWQINIFHAVIYCFVRWICFARRYFLMSINLENEVNSHIVWRPSVFGFASFIVTLQWMFYVVLIWAVTKIRIACTVINSIEISVRYLSLSLF